MAGPCGGDDFQLIFVLQTAIGKMNAAVSMEFYKYGLWMLGKK